MFVKIFAQLKIVCYSGVIQSLDTLMKKALSISTDAKTVKGESLGILTGILYLAPHTISGFQVCPKASPQCREACLYTAGRGIYTKVQQARIAKTLEFFNNRDNFMAVLVDDIKALIKKAKKEKMTPAIRLNGTSDIAWEKIACVVDGEKFKNVMEAFPEVQFYCYTKVLGRKYALSLPNYHLTFSLSEENDSDALKALEQGYNIAVVMNTKKDEKKPATWGGYPVVDGDETDVRFYDPKGGHIVALSAKGQAKKMALGFVRDKTGGFTVNKGISIAVI